MSIDSGKVPNSVDLQVNGITYMSMIIHPSSLVLPPCKMRFLAFLTKISNICLMLCLFLSLFCRGVGHESELLQFIPNSKQCVNQLIHICLCFNPRSGMSLQATTGRDLLARLHAMPATIHATLVISFNTQQYLLHGVKIFQLEYQKQKLFDYEFTKDNSYIKAAMSD